jgi:O-antigen/teichoic acid export membrane protein
MAGRLQQLARPSGRPPVATTTRVIFANASSLVATFGATSILGMAFWLVAARYASRSDVGFAGGAVSAMALLGQLCTLGLGTMLVGELPRRRTPPRSLVASAMLAAGTTGIVGGLIFALAAPEVSREYHRLVDGAGGFLVFTVGVSLTAATIVFDSATIGALRGGLQLTRNVAFAATKVAVLFPFALSLRPGATVLLLAWVSGIAVSLVVVFVLAHTRTSRVRDLRPRLAPLRGVWKEAIGHQAFNVSFNAPVLVLPILVLGLASAAANASFYIALQIASALYVVSTALTTVLFAIGRREPSALRARVRLTLELSVTAGVLGVVVIAFLGKWLLAVFGSSYSDGALVLLVLAVAALPLAVKSHFLAISRIEQRLKSRLPLVWTGACVEIAAGAGGAELDGARGAAIGWVVALLVEAAVMSPVVSRTIGGRLSSAPTGGSA